MKAFAVVAVSVLGCIDYPEALEVGAPSPIETSGPALVWAFDASRCLGCTLNDPSRVIRRIQRLHGDQLEMVVVGITETRDEHRPVVRDFLRGNRIDARLEMWSQTQYAFGFGFGSPEPAVYLLDDSTVVHIAEYVDSELVDFISAFLE